MNQQLITAAYAAWCEGNDLRTRRRRFLRYTYGNQWGDMMVDNDGNSMTECEYLMRQFRQPLTNNLIRRLVRVIVGRYRHLAAANGLYSGPIAKAARINNLSELDSRMLEEFLISGIAVQRVADGADGTPTVMNVSPDDFFAGRFSDPCCRDLEMAGMLHSMSIHEVLARFGNNSQRRIDELRAIFGHSDDNAPAISPAGHRFFVDDDSARCRVIELWTLDAVHRRNRRRVDISFVWKCRWLAPDGHLLSEYTSPWRHGSHPFALKMYPLTDGKVHPFVEDIIDQQRHVNRLIVMIDRIMTTAAKGVLLFPVEQRVKGFSWDDIRSRWAAPDGIIPITGQADALPQQITGNGADAGAHKLLELELKLFEDTSGVSNALMGENSGGNSGSALYESRVSNSTIALQDIFDSFGDFTTRRNYLLQNLARKD